MAAEADKGLLATMAPRLATIKASVDAIDVGGVPVFDILPTRARSDRQDRIHLEIHGGALVFGAGEACRAMGLLAAARLGLHTWSVDYRMPPDHPYPASLDDCVTVYRALLERYEPGNIVVSGGSAGGNLAAALMLRARDEGLALPAAVFLFTPEVDLTESGDSFETNLGIDTVLTQRLMPFNVLYAGGHDLAHPYVSPLFGDFTKGYPPTFLQTGTRDLFLSNTVRMHRRLRQAGIPAELHVFEAMPHGGFHGAPDDEEVDLEVRRYLDALWP
jgi:epsilon-lactone hydrolase